jgi:hypothetical protein
VYCLDTNVFLDWWERRYPPDLFPSLEDKMTALAVNATICSPERVWDEIQHVGSSGLMVWAKANRNIFQAHDLALQKEANTIQTKYPGLIDPFARHDEADRYIIALAKLRGFAVVTHETSAQSKRNPPRSHYIPDVCVAEAIRCLNFVDLMREQKWSF